MKRFIRQLGRTTAQVITDVNTSKKLLREDIIDLIGGEKKRAKALAKVKAALEQMDINYHGDKDIAIHRVLSDIDSYL